jgi:hypothetical protein
MNTGSSEARPGATSRQSQFFGSPPAGGASLGGAASEPASGQRPSVSQASSAQRLGQARAAIVCGGHSGGPSTSASRRQSGVNDPPPSVERPSKKPLSTNEPSTK